MTDAFQELWAASSNGSLGNTLLALVCFFIYKTEQALKNIQKKLDTLIGQRGKKK